jgi:hypothetical protein
MLWTSWDERTDRGKTVYPLPLPVERGYNKPAVLSMVKSGRSLIRWRERHQQQMKIRSDLGNRHPVTIDQLVMPAVELLEGWSQPDHDLWLWKSIGFQIFLRTKYVPSLVKIRWRMLILECSQGCYMVKNLPSDLDLWPMTLKIFQWILTKLGTYLVLKRIWNPIDFQGQRSRSPGQIFTA